MLYVKLQSPLIGSIWLELPVRDTALADSFVQGLELGWSLGRAEPLERIDLRLSKHPTEKLISTEQLRQWLRNSDTQEEQT